MVEKVDCPVGSVEFPFLGAIAKEHCGFDLPVIVTRAFIAYADMRSHIYWSNVATALIEEHVDRLRHNIHRSKHLRKAV